MSHDLDDEELKATRRLLGLEKEGIEKNIKNLKEYIKEDDIYTRYKNGEYNELSDFEMFCINHCKDIEVVLGNLEALCDMQRSADIELKNARKINEEHKKENALLREKVKELEEENKKYTVRFEKLDDELWERVKQCKNMQTEIDRLYTDKEELQQAYLHEKLLKEKVEELLEESIPKQKIKDKIEELKNAKRETTRENWHYIYTIQLKILEELLEGE